MKIVANVLGLISKKTFANEKLYEYIWKLNYACFYGLSENESQNFVV